LIIFRYAAGAALLVWLVWPLVRDYHTGEIRLERTGRNHKNLSRDEMPLVYHVFQGVRILAGLLVVSIVTGWFHQWIKWSI